MSNYTRVNDFSVKDSLPSGNVNKKIVGAQVDQEFDALVVAVGTKLDDISGGVTGNIPLIGTSGTTLTDSTYDVTEMANNYINVVTYGATGDGVTDDTTAINNAYTAARAGSNALVVWPAGTYLVTDGIDAHGVSTLGLGATLDANLAATSSYAFLWGGSDTFVTGMIFDLSNSTTETPMQGIYNSYNDVSRQRFFNNYYICNTFRASGLPNIYGLWCMGTGLSGLHVYNNTFVGYYGFQLNNQDSGARDVNTNPLGDPTYDVFVHDNQFIDSACSVNTPHIFCYNVQIHNNTFRQVSRNVSMPISVAHVSGLMVSNNIVSCNSGAVGAIHIEDVCQKAMISNNVIELTALNYGILIIDESGVSQDDQPTKRIVIEGNYIYGYGTSGSLSGIAIADAYSYNTLVSGNHIANFARGVDITGNNDVCDNFFVDCGVGIRFAGGYQIARGNEFTGCTYIAKNPSGGSVILSGGTIYGDTFAFDKTGDGTFLLNDVALRWTTTTTFSSGVAFDVCPVPSYKFDGTITIQFGSGFGFSKHTVSYNGVTLTDTLVANVTPSTLGGLTLSLSGTTLQATPSVASGTAGMIIMIDGLVY